MTLSSDTFPNMTIESIADSRPGAIKIGPFGSQLRKEEMASSGRKVYGQENVISEDWSLGNRRITDAKFRLLSGCRLDPGDVVLTMMGTIGKCAVFPDDAEPGLMDSHLLKIQPDPRVVDRSYLRLVIQAEQVVGRQVVRMSHGSIMSGLSSGIVRRLRVPVPSLPEQRRIATILDTADEAIRRTEQLIAKLEQMKRGLLYDLLTRGIDENGELRDRKRDSTQHSPIGQCPAHWGFVRLQDVTAHVTKGATPTTFGFSWADSEGVVFLRSECVRDGSFSLEGSERISLAAHRAMQRSQILPGDLLMTITGYIGRSCIYPTSMPEGNINQHIARIRVLPGSNVDPGFVMWALQDRRQRALLERDLTGLAYPQISLAQVQAIPLPVPPMVEQLQIAGILDAHESRIRQESALLAKLRLLKRGLMDDLLTGRVRVPNLVEGDSA